MVAAAPKIESDLVDLRPDRVFEIQDRPFVEGFRTLPATGAVVPSKILSILPGIAD
jgi:hypothetical protein